MKRSIAVLLLIIFMTSMVGCSKKAELTRYEASFLELFNTITTVVGYGSSKEEFSIFAQDVYDTLEKYHKLYDIYTDYEGVNNIKTINDNAGIQPIKVEQEIIDLLKYSKEAYDLSEGEINIGFGAVLKVWHQYREEGTDDPEIAKLPPMELLEEKEKHTDINKLIIDENASTVYLEDPEMSLDVGGIAKGYATEMVAKEMAEKGYDHAMFSVGGNIRAINKKADGSPWKVGIQNPDLESEQANLFIMSIDNYSLVSSGDYQRYYTVDGVEYHHIIDPDTLMPSEYFSSVSIICPDSGMGDVLSTTIFNIPFEEGIEMIEQLEGIEALWVFKDGTMEYSSGFESLIVK